VRRDFTATAPAQLWVADIAYLPTRERSLFLTVVIDACRCMCPGGHAAQARSRRPAPRRLRSPYAFGATLREWGVLASLGSRDDAHDAPAETIGSLHETGPIRWHGPWKGIDVVVHTTSEWSDRSK